MKIFYWLLGIITTTLVGIYILLFTYMGNGILKQVIEKEIQKSTNLTSEFKTFSLSIHDFEFLLELNPNNTITVNGDYSLWNRSLDMNYNVDLNDVKSLKELFKEEIDTPLHLIGTAVGDSSLLIVEGQSDVSSSKSSFKVELVAFEAKNIVFNIKSLKIKEALVILHQPPYSDGELDVLVNISNLSHGLLNGYIDTKISKGLLNSKYISKAYEFNSIMPYTNFNISTHSILDGNFVDTSLDLNSNLVNLDVNKFHYDIEEESLISDYEVNIHDLDRLYFISQRHLLGSLKAQGEVKKSEDLDLSIESYVAGGKLNATLHNNKFDAKISNMKSIDILTILKYPKIFDARLNAVVDYNLESKKGLFDGKLSKGRFTENEAFDLLKKYAQTDVYKEKFTGDVNAVINADQVIASLSLHSNRSSIISKGTKIDSQKSLIDSKVEINANGNKVDVNLKGDINKPNVKINADELIKEEATKVIKKELGKFLKGFF
ncbi:hypothetical protein [Sulfurimonas sp.]|jgi:hypothetical protein|uniref:hypothetical protein n=1 Tax=Sulfurimonas sp. TaxID=2022749 RepID=UPI0025FA6949|nr:hypothetical protein [Sulfurimonas sp.]MBT5935892.1 hypothetical protein [Sulfurimonas sp.]